MVCSILVKMVCSILVKMVCSLWGMLTFPFCSNHFPIIFKSLRRKTQIPLHSWYRGGSLFVVTIGPCPGFYWGVAETWPGFFSISYAEIAFHVHRACAFYGKSMAHSVFQILEKKHNLKILFCA